MLSGGGFSKKVQLYLFFGRARMFARGTPGHRAVAKKWVLFIRGIMYAGAADIFPDVVSGEWKILVRGLIFLGQLFSFFGWGFMFSTGGVWVGVRFRGRITMTRDE